MRTRVRIPAPPLMPSWRNQADAPVSEAGGLNGRAGSIPAGGTCGGPRPRRIHADAGRPGPPRAGDPVRLRPAASMLVWRNQADARARGARGGDPVPVRSRGRALRGGGNLEIGPAARRRGGARRRPGPTEGRTAGALTGLENRDGPGARVGSIPTPSALDGWPSLVRRRVANPRSGRVPAGVRILLHPLRSVSRRARNAVGNRGGPEGPPGSIPGRSASGPGGRTAKAPGCNPGGGGSIPPRDSLLVWRNGLRGGLKNRWAHAVRAGSTPATSIQCWVGSGVVQR